MGRAIAKDAKCLTSKETPGTPVPSSYKATHSDSFHGRTVETMRSSRRTMMSVLLCLSTVLPGTGWAADPPTPPADSVPAATTPADLAKLKAQLDQQQKEIEQLLAALAAQRKMLEQAGLATPAQAQAQQRTPSDRLIASTTPMLTPPTPAAPAPALP